MEDRDTWLELLFVELVQPSLGLMVDDSPRESKQHAERVVHNQGRSEAAAGGRIDNPSYGPAIVYDFPASQGALARIRDEHPPVAERFELFVRGIELANGYHELLDPAELRRRATAANAQRAADGKPRLPEDNRLLAAMEHGLPPCSGVALGFDRLVMVALGAKSIDEVMAFPIERA